MLTLNRCVSSIKAIRNGISPAPVQTQQPLCSSSVLGYSVGCDQGCVPPHLLPSDELKVGGALFLYPCHDSTMVAPSGAAAGTLRAHPCSWAIKDPQNDSQNQSAHCETPHRRGGTERSCL